MDRKLIENILALSSICGFISAWLALIPYMGLLSALFIICFVSLPVIIILQKTQLLKSFTVKESMIIGAFSGFVSYMAFSILFIALVYLLSLFFNMSYLGGFVLILKLSNFLLLLLFVLFVSTIAVMFNSFTALIYYYICDSLSGIDNEKDFKLK